MTLASVSYQLTAKLALVMERNELQFGKTMDEISVEFHLQNLEMNFKSGLVN